MERAVREACIIAGIAPLPAAEIPEAPGPSIQTENIVFLDAAECLARAYARKLSALKAPEAALLEGRPVLLLEMGHVHTTAIIVKPQPDLQSVTIEKTVHSAQVGSFQFDCALYAHFARHLQTKHQCQVEPGTKKGMRLMRECERLRKLLSQLPTSSVTIENISESGDVNITMNREELAQICQEPLQRLSQVLRDAFEGIKEEIAAIEIVGGGVRMAMVQEIILSVLGRDLPLGAKLDDGSIAVGAAILANEQNKTPPQDPPTDSEPSLTTEDTSEPTIPLPEVPTSGLSLESLIQARQAEILMQVRLPPSCLSGAHAFNRRKTERSVNNLSAGTFLKGTSSR
jgi:molecular chaperone DnaK (HSP70)